MGRLNAYTYSEISWWGYSEPDYSKDVLKTNVQIQKTQSPVEQFTIRMLESEGGINIYVEWADVQLVVPVVGQ